MAEGTIFLALANSKNFCAGAEGTFVTGMFKHGSYMDVTGSSTRRLVLVEDAPYIHDESIKSQFFSIVREYVTSSSHKYQLTVLI